MCFKAFSIERKKILLYHELQTKSDGNFDMFFGMSAIFNGQLNFFNLSFNLCKKHLSSSKKKVRTHVRGVKPFGTNTHIRKVCPDHVDEGGLKLTSLFILSGFRFT